MQDIPTKGVHTNRSGKNREVVDIDPQRCIWYKLPEQDGWHWCTPAAWQKWRTE